MSEPPLNLVICGASGDLTARKLVPSLYRLDRKKRLPQDVRVVGVARSPFTHDSFREKMREAVQEFAKKDWDAATWESFARRLFYVPSDAAAPGGLEKVAEWLKKESGGTTGRHLFYLAVAPNLYAGIVANLGAAGLNRDDDGWSRLIIEKPFGRDLASARDLNAKVRSHFREDQVFRIDHYLGKETVQNILVLRFANILFEPLWNSSFIDHVQITVGEEVTVEGRGAYYDKAGVLRDMFQNHLLQLLALVGMEAPARYAADTLRNEKVKVLDAIEPLSVDDAGKNLHIAQYSGYLQEPGVAPKSRTPTFAAMRLFIDNWRWRGVPFYLRSGKALNARSSEVLVQFRCPPHLMFPLPAGCQLSCNRLALCIQPDEGIHLNFQSKVPDREGMAMQNTDMEFHYRTSYADVAIPEAYERLLLDGIHGEAALFMRSDEIERAWTLMDPFIAAAEKGSGSVEEYAVGSAGPAGADAFLARDNRRWESLCHRDADH